MPVSQIARHNSEQYMNNEDKENYLKYFNELKNAGNIDPITRILNIHQVFDENWEYKGAWFTCDAGLSSNLFWLLFDIEWRTLAVSYDSPIPMYKFLYAKILQKTVIHYRAYNTIALNEDWYLLSAGTLDISRFVP